jgi:hypothetical protein
VKRPAAPVDQKRTRSTADVEGVLPDPAAAGDTKLDAAFTRYCGWTALGGGAGWLAVVGHLGPSPFETDWARALLLLAPMVLVPLILGLVRPRAGDSRWTAIAWRAAVIAVVPAALALVAAYTRPQGPGAAALAAPWLGFAGILACLGLTRIVRRWRRNRSELLPGLAVEAGLVYLAVGGAWALLDRWGARPLGFEPVIVLLTAIHFHYAGLCLPVLTGFAGLDVRGRTARVAAGGVIVGVPMVAAGITATQLGLGSALEAAAAWVTALSGLLSASLHLRLASRPGMPAAARALWALAGAALAASMVLAGLYGTRAVFPVEGLDIPRMRALHGSANAIGVALAGVLGWVLAERSRRRE